MASFGMLGSDEAFQVGPFLLIDLKRTVSLLPLIVDHNGSDGQSALIERGEPSFIVRLRGLFVGRASVRN